MAVPSQMLPRRQRRCGSCGRFLRSQGQPCAACGAQPQPAGHARVLLRLLVPPEPPAAVGAGPTAPRAQRSGPTSGGRARCLACGRYVASTMSYCARCHPLPQILPSHEAIVPIPAPSAESGPVALPAPRMVIEPTAPPVPPAHVPPPPSIFERTRSEFVVPRPSELHAGDTNGGAGGAGTAGPRPGSGGRLSRPAATIRRLLTKALSAQRRSDR